MGSSLFSIEKGLKNIKQWLIVLLTLGVLAVENDVVFPVTELVWWAFLIVLILHFVVIGGLVNGIVGIFKS